MNSRKISSLSTKLRKPLRTLSLVLTLLLTFWLSTLSSFPEESSSTPFHSKAPKPPLTSVNSTAPILSKEPLKNPETDPETATDIRDAITLLPLHSFAQWLPWLAITFALLLLSLLLFILWKRGKKEKPLLPHQLALAKLAKAHLLISQKKPRFYIDTVSEIIRHYLENRFEVRAKDRTTEEFLHDLVQQPKEALAGSTHVLQDFLNNCDLVKFAQADLSQEEMEAIHNDAIHFVQTTQPKLEEEIQPPTSGQPPHTPLRLRPPLATQTTTSLLENTSPAKPSTQL